MQDKLEISAYLHRAILSSTSMQHYEAKAPEKILNMKYRKHKQPRSPSKSMIITRIPLANVVLCDKSDLNRAFDTWRDGTGMVRRSIPPNFTITYLVTSGIPDAGILIRGECKGINETILNGHRTNPH